MYPRLSHFLPTSPPMVLQPFLWTLSMTLTASTGGLSGPNIQYDAMVYAVLRPNHQSSRQRFWIAEY